ncbi:MAG: DUF2975 domain-containing protein [Hyphomonadaceae bacterium]
MFGKNESDSMSAAGSNSVAAILRVFVRVIFWATVIFGGLAFVLLLLGLFTSLNGGELNAQIGNAVSGDLSPATFLASLAGLIVLVPGISYICMQLNRILATLAAGDPFIPENAPRLTRIAGTIAIMELARYVLIFLMFLFGDFGEDIEGVRFSVSLVAWVSAAAMLVFSQVFREGSRLREEEKMTV